MIYISFRALKTGRNTSLCGAFLTCFAEINTFDIYPQYTYIVFILKYRKVQDKCQIV